MTRLLYFYEWLYRRIWKLTMKGSVYDLANYYDRKKRCTVMTSKEREAEYQYLRRSIKAMDEPGERISKKMVDAIRAELTPRQKQMVELYYKRQLTMAMIAVQLGVNVSTVSRTLARGRRRLHRSLRFADIRFLDA